MKNKILTYFEKLAEKYGKSFLALEGIYIIDNNIIKINNGGRW